MRAPPRRAGAPPHAPFGRSALALLVALALLTFPAASAAQEEGAIAGTVRDSTTQTPLSAVLVQVIGPGAAAVASATTGPDGAFRIVGVPAGTYGLRFTLPGWQVRTLEGQRLEAGRTTSVTVELVERSYNLNPITVTASKTVEKVLDAPAAVHVVSERDIQERPALTQADHAKGVAGVDIISTGLQGHYVVARGFNNIFSGSMLTLTDNRIARVPSLRANISHLNPTVDLDIERMELVLGPASALYGPNVTNGVFHAITRSPIDDPGASFSVAGGLREQSDEPGIADNDEELFHGVGSVSLAPSDRFGIRLSGQYFTGTEYRFVDQAEEAQRALASDCIATGFDLTQPDCLNFSEGLNLQDPADQALLVESVQNVAAGRNNDLERWSFDSRVDIRPEPGMALIFSGGRTQAVSSIDLTGLGAAQVVDWSYNYLQGRFSWEDLFAQVFWNKSDNDDTYLLRSGRPLIDKSELFVGQLQHATRLSQRQNFIYGLDLLRTVPQTEGTINGQNEDDDDLTEIGAYVQSETRLGDRFDLFLAARLDDHSRLEDPVFSPRAALVFKPDQAHSFRATYNRAFSTPSTLNLFLDISGASVPLFGPFRYDVRAQGATDQGLSFRREGGVPMHMSPFAPLLGQSPRTFLPTTTGQLWMEMVAVAQLLAQAGQLPPDVAEFLASIPPPAPEQVPVVAARLNPQTEEFEPLPGGLAGIQDIDRLEPTITNTFELGYKGLIGERLLLAANLWYSHIDDWVSALLVNTPNVLLPAQALGPYFVSQGLDEPTAQAVAGALGQIPLGVVTVEQAGGTDPALVLTYRNLGDVDLFGTDLSATVLLADEWELRGTLSLVSDDEFTAEEGEVTEEVIPLNAPTTKGTLSLRYRAQGEHGFNGQLRFRAQNGFEANSGVYSGEVDSFSVFDLTLGYRLPAVRRVAVQFDVQNLFDQEYRSFVGTPSLGRFAMVRVRYDLSPF